MSEQEFGYDDPVLGEVSCSDERQARQMARATKGKPYVKSWENGVETSKTELIGIRFDSDGICMTCDLPGTGFVSDGVCTCLDEDSIS
jgi:hypothetical protein